MMSGSIFARRRWPLLIAGLALVAGAAHAAPPERPVVQTNVGKVRGETLDVNGTTVRVFRGVPFAAPPVGRLRWRPPQPVAPWADVRECVKFAPACPQPADMTYNFAYKDQSEDCLYLNVWTAAADDAERRPVMVWIHGGGNTIGGAYAPVYDGRQFAAAGVVLVSVQYRLGAFGYLAHPALSAEARALDGREASGNYGLLDLIAALQWVRDNIAHFGGDPARVTIFGESAGAANVTHLMASPLAKGLFHRAIAESGYFGPNTPSLRGGGGLLERSGHSQGLDFAKRFGIEGEDAATLDKLRALPVDKILSLPVAVGSIRSGLERENGGEGGGRPLRFGPVIDGYVLPRSPGEVWAAGEMHRVPFIAGSNLDDGSVFSRANPIKGLIGYRLALRTMLGADAPRAQELFPAASDDEVQQAIHRLITVSSFRAPARRLARWIEAAGGQAWLYHFTRSPRQGAAARGGVIHGLEIPYVFNTLTTIGGETDRALAADMLQRWVNFARDGDPNGVDAERRPTPLWPAYRAATDENLEFGDTVRVVNGLDREACDLFDKAAARRRN